MTEAYRQLTNQQHYRKLDEEPTKDHANKVKNLIQVMYNNGHLDKDAFKYLTPKHPKIARFYHQPKIHKPTIPVPGRPIVSSCGSPTERISEYVDYHLQPLVAKTPSYLKDTTDFLQKLSTLTDLPPGCILVTLDVSSLYTNIPHDEGMAACKKALQTRPSPAPPTQYLTQMIEQILTMNSFSFNNECYLQTQGTAMGTRMAPSYANLFMAELEDKLLTWTTHQPHIWWRFIDDIFAIWKLGETTLTEFLEEINLFHPMIKFTAQSSEERVDFLDTTVILDGTTIHTDLYTKPTDTHQYLSPESCHPRHCTASIPYSQSLRLKRICSRTKDFTVRTNQLKTHLLARGYKDHLVSQQIQKAADVPRTESLESHPPRQRLQRTPLVVTFHPSLSSLPSIARKHLGILHASQRLEKAIPNPPLVSFRRPRNLRNLLVRAQVPTPAPPTLNGNAPCNSRRCKCCKEIETCNTFKSKNTGRKYDIKATLTCKSKNLVYLISCKRCGLQYIGETENALHIRMNGHRSDIRTKKLDKPVAAHFCQSDHSAEDLEVRGIEKIHENNTDRRKRRESYWMFTLKTLAPQGMNLDE